jgi:hypothetical protein
VELSIRDARALLQGLAPCARLVCPLACLPLGACTASAASACCRPPSLAGSCCLQVTILARHPSDEVLVMASDGLWDVMSNQEAVTLAKKCLGRARSRGSTRQVRRRAAATPPTPPPAAAHACSAAPQRCMLHCCRGCSISRFAAADPLLTCAAALLSCCCRARRAWPPRC